MDRIYEVSKRHLPDPKIVLVPKFKFLLQNIKAFNYLKTPNINNCVPFKSWKTSSRFLCIVKSETDITFQPKKYVKPYFSCQVTHISISSSMVFQELDAFPEITNNSKARPHMGKPIYPHNSLQWVFMNLLLQCKGSDCQWKSSCKNARLTGQREQV